MCVFGCQWVMMRNCVKGFVYICEIWESARYEIRMDYTWFILGTIFSKVHIVLLFNVNIQYAFIQKRANNLLFYTVLWQKSVMENLFQNKLQYN